MAPRNSMPSSAPALAAAVAHIGRCLIFGAACFAGLSVTTILAKVIDPRVDMYGSRLAVPSLFVGLSIAGLMLGGRRLWPGIGLGALVGSLVLLHEPPLYAIYYAAENVLVILVVVALLTRWRFSRGFDRWQDPLLLFGAAIVGGTMISALTFVGFMGYQWLRPGELNPALTALITNAAGATPVVTGAFLAGLARWGADRAAGVVVFVPLLVATPPILRTLRGRGVEAAFWCLALLGWVAGLFTLHEVGARLPLVVTALVLLVWAVARFGVAMASLATSVCAMAATLSFALQRGVLTTMEVNEGVDALWGFLLLLAGIGMFLTALLAERRRDRERLIAVADRYQRLFRANPSPLWVAEPGGGRILMVNDAARRQYGYSEDEFLAMTVALLAAEPGMISAPASGPGGTRLQRHRTRGGAHIDVELLSTPIEFEGRFVDLCYAADVTARQELRSRILSAATIERGRLAQELHDGLGQVLAGLSLGAQSAATRTARGSSIDAAFVNFLVDAGNQAANMWRQLTRGVSPLQDANGDLLEALRRLPASLPPGSGPALDVEIESRAPLVLSLERSEHLYRVVQEAVANAVKHARAARIRVRVVVTTETARVDVEDDGIGIGPEALRSAGLGMRSMELRARAVGAAVEVAKSPIGGTLIRCDCPQQERVESQPQESDAREAADESDTKIVKERAPAPMIDGSTLAYAARCVLLAVACFAGFTFSVVLTRITDPHVDMNNSSRLAVPSLLVGIGVAALILGGKRLWPGIAMGSLIGMAVLFHEPLVYSIYFGGAMAVAVLIIVELLSRWRFSRAFDRWQDPLLLFGAAFIGGSAISAFDFVGILTYQWLRPGEMAPTLTAMITNAAGATPVVTGAFLAALARWGADSVAGAVLFVPLLVATPPILRTLRGLRAEAVLWCLSLLGWVVSMFALNEVGARLPLVAIALALLVWAAERFGVAMASLATSICAMTATLSFASQRGVLTTIGLNEGVDALWSFLLLLAGTGMFLTALLAERNRRLRQLTDTAQRARRLFERDPHPLWVQDRTTGRILMVNERAVTHYGYSEKEWLALTDEGLAGTPAGSNIARPAHDFARLETRHRLKNGTLIDVELSYAPIDMDDRPTLLCFAIDVTERNALQRGFLEATDLERRNLANDLNRGLGRALAELEAAAKGLETWDGAGQVDAAAVERVAQTSRSAADACRQAAHNVAQALR
jgi:PAS domain S-box-containing protein